MSQPIGRRVSRPTNPSETKESSVSSPIFMEDWPDLYKFLQNSRGSGQNPTTGTVTLFIENGRFKLCLNDRPNARSCFVTADTLTQALETADVGIRGDLLRWRKKGYHKPQKRQKYLSQS